MTRLYRLAPSAGTVVILVFLVSWWIQYYSGGLSLPFAVFLVRHCRWDQRARRRWAMARLRPFGRKDAQVGLPG